VEHGRTRVRAISGLSLALWWCACAAALDPSLDVNQYAHTAWKLREGFATGEIHVIAQTPDGYLWLASEAGLLRFDGVRTVPWTPPPGEHLPSNDIRYIVAGRDGTLWLGTAKGLVSWGHGVLTHYPELDGHDVLAMLEDHEGTVWAAGIVWERGLSQPGKLCAIKGRAIQCYGSDGSLSYGVTTMYEDSRGNLWLGAGNGLWRWRPGPPKQYMFPEVKDYAPDWAFSHNAIIEDQNGTLLVACPPPIRGPSRPGQVWQLAGEQLRLYPLPPGVPRFNSGTLLRDRDGGFWIGTQDSGIVHVHRGRVDLFSESDGLSDNRVESFFEDREGNVWAATANGVDRFRENTVSTVSVKQGVSTPFVVCILAGQNGSLWLGTADGLNRWNNGRMTVYRRPPSVGGPGRIPNQGSIQTARANVQEIISEELPDNYITSLYQDARGRIWIATRGGIAYFENGRVVRFEGAPITAATHITGDSSGDVWIPNTNDAIYHLRDGEVVERIPWSQLGSGGSFSVQIVADSHGGLWLASWSGRVIYLKDGQVRASYSAADGLGSGRVNAIQLDRDGTVWAATDGGLSRIKEGRIKTLTSGNGLPCDVVHDIIEDDAHAFWLKTACGLVRIAFSELEAWIADAQHRIAVTVFDTSYGVRSHAGVYDFGPRVARTADGKLWFLPLEGVSFIDPRRLPFNQVPPPVHIEQIVADGKSYEASSGLRLPALVRNVWIDYTALSFVAPEKVRFRYKLDGQDSDWREVVNDRQVQYTNLPPRRYRFRVIAANNSGVWNEQGDTLEFTIPPAWYQTLWFRSLCAAVFFLLLWTFYRLRVLELRREERKFREAVESMPALAFVNAPNGDRAFINRAYLEYTGLSPEQASGSGWEKVIHPDDLKRVLQRWRTAQDAGQLLEYEVRVRRGSDGVYRWFQTRARPLCDKRGRIVKWCAVSIDIEDRKRAEQLQSELAHVSRVSTMGELSASISHDLNQPIAASIMNASLALEFLERNPPDLTQVRERTTKTIEMGTLASEIIDRLRALYKKEPPKHESLAINEVISEMVELLRGQATRHGISIRADLAGEVPDVIADRVQIQQVLMNLMLNGIEAMSDTGGVLTIKSQLSQHGQIEISVDDTGPGLPPGQADRIFDAFFTTKPQGSGMGLAISKSIVESHGGRIWANGAGGQGARFHFTLPVGSANADVSTS